MTTITKVPITDKESEGLMWGLAQIGDHAHRKNVTDPSDPLFILLSMGYKAGNIKDCCEGLFELAYAHCLNDQLTQLERIILRLAVENSSWVWHYKHHCPEETTMANQARKALRSLAEKLELIDISVNYLPED